MDLHDLISKIFLFYLPLLFSLCVHECAHAWTAWKLGDPTAASMGRLTLNPAAHVDILGTLILPFAFLITSSPFFFGWAKPVPVDERAFQNPRKDMFWVAFAGPLSNFLLALCGALILPVFYMAKLKGMISGEAAFMALEKFIYVNLLLGVFNLLPLHPLDGSKVLARFLPVRWNIFLEKHQKYSYYLLIFIIFGGVFIARPVFEGSQALIDLSQKVFLWIAGG